MVIESRLLRELSNNLPRPPSDHNTGGPRRFEGLCRRWYRLYVPTVYVLHTTLRMYVMGSGWSDVTPFHNVTTSDVPKQGGMANHRLGLGRLQSETRSPKNS